MKTIQRLSILTVALMTLASSCNRDEAGLNPSGQYGTVTITADAAWTKTVIDDGGTVKWEDGDEIALRFTHDTEQAVVGKFTTSIEDGPAASADFTGTVALDVLKEDGGYHDASYAVYPADALTAGGVTFALPAAQQAREDGSFAARLNLTSAALSLDDIRDDGKASATFLNALSILRFSVTGDDVTSVTLTGTAPLAGSAPVVFSADGRLVIDADAEWKDAAKEMSVTLTPAYGSECFAEGTVYNLLVWPGTHQSLTATLDFKDYGAFDKTSVNEFTFAASKFYTLDFNADSETLVKEISDPLDAMDLELPGLADRIAALETTAEKISVLLDQIQSVAIMTEYLDNSVYASYAQLMYKKLKMDVRMDFMVRPAKAAELLLDLCVTEGNLSDVLSARIDYKNGSLGSLTVNDAMLDGDVLTVMLEADNIDDSFYEGNSVASVALQISDGNTEILSDFAKLVPRTGAMMNITRTKDIPVLKGAGFSMNFSFGASDMEACTIAVENAVGFSSAPVVSANTGSGTGYFHADFAEDADLSQMSVDLVLTCGEESDIQTLTFADGGDFVVETSGTVDYIGGEVSVNVVSNSFGSVTSELKNAGDWIYQTYSGNNSSLTVNANTGSERTAYVEFTVSNTGGISYTKSVAIAQKAYGTAIDESRYHQTKGCLELQAATAGYTPLNIVIVGDGYQKKDLLKGGKFERSARSAMEAFFGVEPYKSFRDRFRVMMVAYESADEGLSLEGGTQKDTYFKSYYKGSGNTYVNLSGADYSSVSAVVRDDLGWSDDATYYRTIVIMLINTSEGIGSNAAVYRDSYSGSALGEPYASMALAMVTANNTETSNLIRHEAGGHAFGRLGDEYPTKEWDSNVNAMHSIGWYRNITVDQNLWNWNEFIGLSGYDDVMYYQPNSTYWCPIDHTKYNSIMYNNLNKFNAPSRRIIYERIIRQTEGASAYSWEKFLEYDKRNL